MALTEAQVELLQNLENGFEVTFKNGHYTTIKDNMAVAKLWPSTFYGLFDGGFVERLDNGNYTVSINGKRQIRSEDK